MSQPPRSFRVPNPQQGQAVGNRLIGESGSNIIQSDNVQDQRAAEIDSDLIRKRDSAAYGHTRTP